MKSTSSARYTTRVLLAAAAFLALAPTGAFATTVYYATTTTQGGNYTVDADHLLEWVSPNLTQTCIVASCQQMNGAVVANWGWSLGGGIFTMKDNGANGAITLSLFQGLVGGSPGTVASPGALTGNLVASKTILTGNISNSFGPVQFFFDNPVTLQPGTDYVMTLTSNTDVSGSYQYFVKSDGALVFADVNNNPPPATDPALSDTPEPGTWSMLGLGGLLCAWSLRRRRRI